MFIGCGKIPRDRLGVNSRMRPMEDDKPQMLEVFLGPLVQFALRVAADHRRYK
jgi:hypothetical protein